MHRLLTPIALALLGLAAAPTLAAERHWTFIGGCGSADWFGKLSGVNTHLQTNCWAATAGGFSGKSLPTTDDNVFIQHDGATDLINALALPGRDTSWTANAKNLSVQGLGQGWASLAIARNSLNVEVLELGASGKGAIQQSGGVVLAHTVALGGAAGSIGRYELSGGELSLTALPADTWRTLNVGHAGHGQLRQSGGSLRSDVVNVGSTSPDGAETTAWTLSGGKAQVWRVTVGPDASRGRLEVSGSARLTASFLVLGDQGQLRLKGGETKVGVLNVGKSSNFLFSDGTLVFSEVAWVDQEFLGAGNQPIPLRFGAGLDAGLPTVRLDSGTRLKVPEIQVGTFGRGRLELQEDAKLQTDRAGVGTSSAPLGVHSEALLDGGGAVWRVSTRLDLGGGIGGDTGSITVRNGALLETGGEAHVHAGGTLRIESGGSWLATDVLNAGVITVSAGGTAIVQRSLALRQGSELEVDGELTVIGWTTMHDGALLTGTGTKVFEGGLELGENALSTVVDGKGSTVFGYGNTLFMDIGGAAPGSFDRYVSRGSVKLGGTLVLMPWQGYTGQAGDSFDLFDGALSGSFDRVYTDNFTLAPGLRWDFSRLSTEGVVGISAVPEPGTWALMLGGLALLSRRRLMKP